jgi:integrase
MRAIAREGGDPAATQSSDQITLADAVLEYHRIIEQSFTSEKHGKIWLSGLRLHVLPHLGDRKLDDIGTADVRRVLEPIWNTKSETARRLKHRREAVFEWGRAEGHTARENPVYGI